MDVTPSSSPANRTRNRVRPANRGRSGAPAESTSRRSACNECKQQKLRCDLVADQNDSPANICSRCDRLDLECRIEDGFRRTRKRLDRSADLEDEINDLRKQLAEARRSVRPESGPAHASTNSNPWTVTEAEALNPTVQASHIDTSLITSEPTAYLEQNAEANASSHTPGLTTRPDAGELQPRRAIPSYMPCPRRLGTILLSVEEIDNLFQIYITCYHPLLPLIDISKSPDQIYQQSELLFWSVIAIASRRLANQPTLLPKLARDVTNLLWMTIRSVSHSIATVQALALICTWPFPVSSSMSDPTFMLVGVMLQLAMQMGLHRAANAQDFTKAPTRLTFDEQNNWIRTWHTCQIVAQSVSVGCGLPLIVQTSDATSIETYENQIPAQNITTLHHRLQLENLRQRVSSALGTGGCEDQAQQRLTRYRLLSTEIARLGDALKGSAEFEWHTIATKLHLQAFYMFDEVSIDGYRQRILELDHTAKDLITMTLELDNRQPRFLSYCPFFCSQVFVCAAFIVLKISTNGYFGSLIDLASSTQLLERSITALRKMSVVNNDIPARLGDVLAFFCALPDPAAVGGRSMEDLRLKQVNTRLSMSIVHDFLRTWRSHFRKQHEDAASTTPGWGNVGDELILFSFVSE